MAYVPVDTPSDRLSPEAFLSESMDITVTLSY